MYVIKLSNLVNNTHSVVNNTVYNTINEVEEAFMTVSNDIDNNQYRLIPNTQGLYVEQVEGNQYTTKDPSIKTTHIECKTTANMIAKIEILPLNI